MKTVQYIVLANTCLIISYLFYKMISKNETNFKQLRFFLLGSIIVSLLLPLNSFKINTDLFSSNSITTNPIGTQQLNIKDNFAGELIINQPVPVKKEINKSKNIDWMWFAKNIYIGISILLLFRVIMQIGQLVYRYYKSEKTKYLHFTILSNTYYKNSFSFFNWIFINKETCLNEDKDKIIAHEIIHASQYHSFDLIQIELLSALMWFNPAIWMMRKSMQLLHEYLADEGALSTGIDKLNYQALLINQLTGERLICISSSFNHSLIKKRMIMMTKSKFNQKSKFKILTILPVSLMLFVIVAIGNGLFPNSIKASPKTLSKIFTSRIIEIRQSQQAVFVEDTTKNIKVFGNSQDKTSTEIKVTGYADQSSQKDTSKLIYIVDGVQVDNIDNLNPDSIESVNVFQQDSILVFRTKKYSPKSYEIKLRNSSGNDFSNTLFIIDGVETLLNPLTTLNQNDIQSISVVKNQFFISSNFKKKYDSLIYITTKSKK